MNADRWNLGSPHRRTALAWQRTGLALFGATAVACRLGLPDRPVATAVALTPTFVLSIGILHLSGLRKTRAPAAHRTRAAGSGGRLPFLTAAAVASLGIAALLAVLG